MCRMLYGHITNPRSYSILSNISLEIGSKETEAEATAMLLCETLNLPGAEYSRAYIQGWLKDDSITERSAQRIFGCVDKILKAGRAQ